MSWRRGLVAGIALSLTITASSAAHADGETVYDADYCGGAHFPAPPSFSPFTDLPYLVGQVTHYAANPHLLFYGALDGDPWTNWYNELDVRDQLAKLAVMRGILDKFGLWDMYLAQLPVVECPEDAETVRQLNGTCNDLVKTSMGARGVRFGRNVMPLGPAAHPNPLTLMSPNPRTVSRELFTRGEGGTKEVPFLNMLAAAWIQFQVHDWFNHETSSSDNFQVELAPDDPLRAHGSHMPVPKTKADPTRLDRNGDGYEDEAALPPSYPNEVTHWWDGSQIYGSDAATADRLRLKKRGHLKLVGGRLPLDANGREDTGFRRNWWVGLSLMHTLFALNHNYIADELAQAYPDKRKDDQWLFDKARMINAAIIVKIHTIEWTPAILPNPALAVGMNANWGGLNQYMTPQLPPGHPAVPAPFESIVYGVAGGARDLKVFPTAAELQSVGVPAGQAAQIAHLFNGPVPYTLTEEFVSVYRMHTLLPDEITLYDLRGKKAKRISSKHSTEPCKGENEGRPFTLSLMDTRDEDAAELVKACKLKNLMYSFGVNKPGALVLENYPEFLQNIDLPGGLTMDIGAVDILRDRERGVPRYNELRRQINLRPLASIDELTDDPNLRAKIKAVYDDDIEKVDLLVGTLAEGTRPTCYGFGETLFQVFTLMATRRIQADRFYTDDFTPAVYTERGMEIIDEATMKHVLLLHFPELADTGLAGISNAFYPWE